MRTSPETAPLTAELLGRLLPSVREINAVLDPDQLLHDRAAAPAARGLLADLDQFVGGAAPADDVTFVVVKIL